MNDVVARYLRAAGPGFLLGAWLFARAPEFERDREELRLKDAWLELDPIECAWGGMGGFCTISSPAPVCLDGGER